MSKDSDSESKSNQPLRGISKSFSSLFCLPAINSATNKISCEDWIVEDKVLKKMVYEGLNSYALKMEEEQAELEMEKQKVSLHNENLKKKNNRKSLITYSWVPSQESPDAEEIDSAHAGNIEPEGEVEIGTEATLILGKAEDIHGEDREDTEELMRDNLSPNFMQQGKSPLLKTPCIKQPLYLESKNVDSDAMDDKENLLPDDDQTFLISQPSNLETSLVKDF